MYHKDLVVATQGRAFWILDNLSSLAQITPSQSTTQVLLYKPRDGYRTRVRPDILGPNIEYYLPSTPTGPVTIDILDSSGAIVNAYSSAAPAPSGGAGRGGGFRGRGGFAPASRVTANQGHNRFVWDVQHQSGVGAPPGQYQARLKVGSTTLTQPFTVLIDPRIAAEGVTVADLEEQFAFNLRMQAMVEEVNALVTRVQEAQARLESGAQVNEQLAQQLDELAPRLITPPVRYSKPGLQEHIRYLAGMTSRVDQKVGQDALDRYEVLRAQLDAMEAEVNALLGIGGGGL